MWVVGKHQLPAIYLVNVFGWVYWALIFRSALRAAKVHLLAGKKEIIKLNVHLDGGRLPVRELAEQHKVQVLQIATTDSEVRPDDTAFQQLKDLTPAVLGGPTSHVWLRVTGKHGLQGCGQWSLPAACW